MVNFMPLSTCVQARLLWRQGMSSESGEPLTMQLCGLGPHLLIHMSRRAHITQGILQDPFQFEVCITLLALTKVSYLTAPLTNDLDLLRGSQGQNPSSGYSVGQN